MPMPCSTGSDKPDRPVTPGLTAVFLGVWKILAGTHPGTDSKVPFRFGREISSPPDTGEPANLQSLPGGPVALPDSSADKGYSEAARSLLGRTMEREEESISPILSAME